MDGPPACGGDSGLFLKQFWSARHSPFRHMRVNNFTLQCPEYMDDPKQFQWLCHDTLILWFSVILRAYLIKLMSTPD